MQLRKRLGAWKRQATSKFMETFFTYDVHMTHPWLGNVPSENQGRDERTMFYLGYRKEGLCSCHPSDEKLLISPCICLVSVVARLQQGKVSTTTRSFSLRTVRKGMCMPKHPIMRFFPTGDLEEEESLASVVVVDHNHIRPVPPFPIQVSSSHFSDKEQHERTNSNRFVVSLVFKSWRVAAVSRDSIPLHSHEMERRCTFGKRKDRLLCTWNA